MTALDTNVLIDLEEGEPEVAEAALAAIERAAARGRIVVCGIVFAELCASPKREPDDVASVLRRAQVAVDPMLEVAVWAHAGRAYAAYAQRRRAAHGTGPRRIVADFVIGAHAVTIGSLVTSDAAFYRRVFPELRVIDVRAA